MGKLAERLADAKRTGVYRIEVTHALEDAVALNGFTLARICLEGISGGALRDVSAQALAPRADGHVALFSGFEVLLRKAPAALDALLANLDAAARRRRAEGLRFFATFLDPAAMLDLAPLYDRRRSSPSRSLLNAANTEEDSHGT